MQGSSSCVVVSLLPFPGGAPFNLLRGCSRQKEMDLEPVSDTICKNRYHVPDNK